MFEEVLFKLHAVDACLSCYCEVLVVDLDYIVHFFLILLLPTHIHPMLLRILHAGKELFHNLEDLILLW